MIGTGRFGIKMLKKISVVASSVLLCSCGIMPGMQNLDTSKMRIEAVRERVSVCPTLIPITPSLIADQHISRYHYHVAPADVLNIHVWQHPEFDFLGVQLSSTATVAGQQGGAGQAGYLVNSDGFIYFPLVGYVHVAGKTMDAIRLDVSKKLTKYVPNPQVNVRVADFRGQKVYVLGEVMKPGFIPINDQPMSIADALALSGGMDPNAANPRFTYIIRGNYLAPQIFWLDAKTADTLLLAQHFSLQPRDVLYVSSAPATRWNRVLSQILPTIQTLWYTQAIVKNS